MDTVNIHCSGCGGLIGVRRPNLGRHVRCPLCRKVIVATAPAPAAADPPAPETDLPEPLFVPLATEEEESIFGSTESASDDLFGAVPPSVIEMPPDTAPEEPEEPVHVSPPASATRLVAPTPEPPAPRLADTDSREATLPRSPDVSSPESPQSVRKAPVPAPVLEEEPLTFAVPPAAVAPAADTEGHFWDSPAQEAGKITVPDVRRLRRPSMVVPILLIFLVPYAVLTTGFIVYLIWVQKSLQPHQDPLERMLEDNGDDDAPGIKRIKPVKFDWPVPARLRVGLNKSLRVGALEVVPLKVARAGSDLALYLSVRNTSRDLLFNPLPAKFTRYTRGAMTASRPFTFLEGGGLRVFGGEVKWQKGQGGPGWVSDSELRPGEYRTVRLTTAWQDRDQVKALLQKRPATLLWRVQLRRGLETIAGEDRVITCVIGVSFRFDQLPGARGR